MKKVIIAIVAVVAVFLLATSGYRDKTNVINEPKTLKIGDVTLNIEVANTDMKREKGLSGREGLEKNGGMLFVFEEEGYYGIWMKDMNFPIDIAWLDKDKKIVYVENAVEPETYPKVFGPPTLSLYVLETNANFFENYKIKIGDIAEF